MEQVLLLAQVGALLLGEQQFGFVTVDYLQQVLNLSVLRPIPTPRHITHLLLTRTILPFILIPEPFQLLINIAPPISSLIQIHLPFQLPLQILNVLFFLFKRFL